MNGVSFSNAQEYAKSGDNNKAFNILNTVLLNDPHNIEGWLLASDIASNNATKEKILLRCLEYNPENSMILERLQDISSIDSIRGWSDILSTVGAWIIILLISGLIILGFIMIGSFQDEVSTADAWCKTYVKKELRNPGSAKFPWYNPDNVRELGNGRYQVNSQVTAENGFGGMSSSSYTCIVVETGNSHWELEYLVID